MKTVNIHNIVKKVLSEDSFDTSDSFKDINKGNLKLILRSKMIEELAAQKSYRSLISQLKESELKNKDKLISAIREIKNDEEMHYGILQKLLTEIDTSFIKNIKKGVDELEDEE
jgi:rubrerythrin